MRQCHFAAPFVVFAFDSTAEASPIALPMQADYNASHGAASRTQVGDDCVMPVCDLFFAHGWLRLRLRGYHGDQLAYCLPDECLMPGKLP